MKGIYGKKSSSGDQDTGEQIPAKGVKPPLMWQP